METTIKCPYCDCEYMPSEILIPKYLMDQPKEIDRDIHGNIIYWDGMRSELSDTYVCDKCNKKFKVTANISFLVEKDSIDISQPYSSSKYSDDRLTLEEI